ncbi:MAG: alternative ribosome rescue aminoacyl-tRNA hydrolase ArfB [Anaerolineales bacterium]|jgi:ribosome-associated protein
MIEVTPTLAIPESELQFDFIRSSGPGGQNVNKVATGVQLRFNVSAAATLPDDVKQRLHRLAGKRINAEGELIIEARRYRSQEKNRSDAVQRLVALLQSAAEKPKKRKKTKPTAAAREKRLSDKKKRGELKRERRTRPEDW